MTWLSSALVRRLAFIILAGGLSDQFAMGQFAKDPQQPILLDPEYRKLDALVSFLRERNTRQFAIRSAKGIDEAGYVLIGGIEQWVTIRGQDRENPVLLLLHGGPGDVTSCWTFRMFAPWEDHFIVVQWDQRGAGHTLKKSGPTSAHTLKVDRMAQDGIELAEYLRKHLGKQKVILVAHSFGSILGLQMVKTRPELFYAYVGSGQIADETKNYSAAYDALLKKARVLNNQRAIEELTKIGPPPYPAGDGYRVQWKWANFFEGADAFIASTLGLALVAPGCSVEDINDSGTGQSFSAEQLVPQTKSKGPKELGLKFSVPMFFFQGAEDFTTPTALARDYLKTLQAPGKKFVAIPGAGHFAVFMHSDQFLEELLKRVRPLAASR